MMHITLLAFAAIVSFSSFAFCQEQGRNTRKKSLVVYFSVTGNTQTLAERVHAQVGGDLVELVPVVPYSKVYSETVARARQEIESNANPEITSAIPNMDDYDTIFIGYPIWAGTIPRALITFFRQNDTKGKTIAPFSTHGGGGPGRSVQDIRALCPDAKVTNGLSMTGRVASGSQQDIAQWLRNNGIAQR